MKQIAVRVDDDLLAAIEKTRGDVPREPWMRGVLRAATSGAHGLPQTHGTAPGVAVRPQPAKATTAPAARRHLPTCGCAVCKPTNAKRAKP